MVSGRPHGARGVSLIGVSQRGGRVSHELHGTPGVAPGAATGIQCQISRPAVMTVALSPSTCAISPHPSSSQCCHRSVARLRHLGGGGSPHALAVAGALWGEAALDEEAIASAQLRPFLVTSPRQWGPAVI